MIILDLVIVEVINATCFCSCKVLVASGMAQSHAPIHPAFEA